MLYRAILSGLLSLVALLPLLASLYLLVLALLTRLHRPRPRHATGRTPVAILVPAHDEEALLGRCLRGLQEARAGIPSRLIVIADNCTDRTAEIAAGERAEVWVRTDLEHRGKGPALRWALDRLLTGTESPDAVVVVDADSVVAPDFLHCLVGAFEAGHPVVQAEYLVLPEGADDRRRLVAAGFLLFHRVRFSGRAMLGLSASLVGNGMLFGAQVLRDHPWQAFSGVEDLEHSITLRRSGIPIHFEATARLWGPVATGRAAGAQRSRWEGGRLATMRREVPRLLAEGVRRRDPQVLEAGAELAVPPLGLLLALDLTGLLVSGALALAGLAFPWVVLPWAAATTALALSVVVGLWAARADRDTFVALLRAPRFMLGKLSLYRRLGRFDPSRWDRTERPGAGATVGAPVRAWVNGIQVEGLHLAEAAELLVARSLLRPSAQACTVNLDFLVQADHDEEVRHLLAESEVNVADGTPVLWLARIGGTSLPGRVTGVDLVPRLAEQCATQGARLFLLGGQRGAAESAATHLEALAPGLQVTALETPPATLEEMDDEAILAAVAEARADLLLVAFGHPKQELWISRNLARLPVGMAIGVGGSLDLLLGRLTRAPGWMQRTGLEWSWRFLQEPRRLGGRYLRDGTWLLRVLPGTVLARFAD
jgi:exopolysaccharide biosynthesis WecB/TagA/CpsF family protein